MPWQPLPRGSASRIRCAIRKSMGQTLIGKSVPRKEGWEKVSGAARYVDDFTLPGLLHGVTVRSPIARGRIREVHFGDKIPWNEFTVVSAADIPGKNRIELILTDQPCLADGIVNHVEEPIIRLAHHDKQLLEEARRAITFDIDPLPAIFDPEQALQKKQIVWGDDNVFKTFLVEKGDITQAFA